MSRFPLIAGVGLTQFFKPKESPSYDELGASAAAEALKDAGLNYTDVQFAFAGYTLGDSTCGQTALYRVGLTGIPIVNVNNACATGSSALHLAQKMIASGSADVVLAVGFEQMNPGALGSAFADRKPPMQQHIDKTLALQGYDPKVPPLPQFFGGAGREYQDRFGVEPQTFAAITVKARRHAANNSKAMFRELVTSEEVLASPMMFEPLTRLQCCPPASGGAAVVLVSPEYAAKNGLSRKVKLRVSMLATDRVSSFEEGMMNVVGFGLSRETARRAYEAAAIGPNEVDVVELHDCFTCNELISYDALGLCRPGEAEAFVRNGDNTYGGSVVTNPSGGLLSKGHPLGATGLAQIAELTSQLRGEAGARQVEGAKVALQHNIGLGSACAISILTT